MKFVLIASTDVIGLTNGGVRGRRLGDGDLGFRAWASLVDVLGLSSIAVVELNLGTGGLFLDGMSRFGRKAFDGGSDGGVRDVDLVA